MLRKQLLWLGTRQQLDKVSTTELSLLSARMQVSTAASNLGVLINTQLNMVYHVASLCRSCFFQLRQLHLVAGPVVTYIRSGQDTRARICQ